MRIRISADPEAERSANVVSRETATGSDGRSQPLSPGATVEVEVNDGHHVVIMAGAPPEGLQSSDARPAQPRAITEDDDDGDEDEDKDTALADTTDDEIRSVIADLDTAGATKTANGAYTVADINSRLEARGFSPINAARRDAVGAGGASTTTTGGPEGGGAGT